MIDVIMIAVPKIQPFYIGKTNSSVKCKCLVQIMYEFLISVYLFSLDFDGTITAYGGGNDDTLNTVKAGAGTIYINDGTGINEKDRLWVIGNTDESGQDETQTWISGGTNDFYYHIISLKGTQA